MLNFEDVEDRDGALFTALSDRGCLVLTRLFPCKQVFVCLGMSGRLLGLRQRER